MDCRRIRKMISRQVDDRLDPDEQVSFDLHIRSCAACRKVLEETQALHQMFASTQRFPAPYGFATRVLANLEQKEGTLRRGRFFIRPYFLRAAQLALALVVMTIGIISGNLLLAERTNPLGQTAVQETFSLDLFQAAPPDSIGGIYYSLMRPGHES
jgi:predicted anti-sigma-YlaC factor YlaD